MTTGTSSRRTLGLRVFFDEDLEDPLPQQPIGQHLLELLVLLLQVAQAPDVRARHHPELFLPAVEGWRRDVQLLADFRLAPAGLVLPDDPNLDLLGVPFLTHRCHIFGLGWWFGNPPVTF
jgi:hypothetical protein